MKYYAMFWVDSLLTLGIAVYLIYVGYKLLVDSLRVLMLFTPQDISLDEIVEKVTKIKSIENIHHIHIWQLNEDEIHLEAHIDFKNDIKLSEFDTILEVIEKLLLDEFHINHINIQPEFQKCDIKDIIVQD
jgi:cobalt-zinc-cadmium efflux system protein